MTNIDVMMLYVFAPIVYGTIYLIPAIIEQFLGGLNEKGSFSSVVYERFCKYKGLIVWFLFGLIYVPLIFIVLL